MNIRNIRNMDISDISPELRGYTIKVLRLHDEVMRNFYNIDKERKDEILKEIDELEKKIIDYRMRAKHKVIK